MTRRRTVLAVACLLIGATASAAVFGQGFGRSRRSAEEFDVQGNTPYDGRFTFVRLRYDSGFQGFGRRGGGPLWSHDYPYGEIHFTKILEELTLLRCRTDGSNILTLDDPELFNYPVAYMAEPGGWMVEEPQAARFREYLQKGGFAIFDDFRGYDWINLQEQMAKVLPEARWIPVEASSPVFHSFYEIDDPMALLPPYGDGEPPSYWGLFEHNDPAGRLMAIANVNNDISEYWEFSNTGLYIVDLSNEAYKFGINYVIYAMTH